MKNNIHKKTNSKRSLSAPDFEVREAVAKRMQCGQRVMFVLICFWQMHLILNTGWEGPCWSKVAGDLIDYVIWKWVEWIEREGKSLHLWLSLNWTFLFWNEITLNHLEVWHVTTLIMEFTLQVPSSIVNLIVLFRKLDSRPEHQGIIFTMIIVQVGLGISSNGSELVLIAKAIKNPVRIPDGVVYRSE